MSEKPDPDEDTMRDEYDFSQGERNRYAERLKEGSNVVVLDPDIAAEFSSSQEVNRALRVYLKSKKKDEQGAA